MGWIGIKRQMIHFLETVNADKDENGAFIILGEMPAFFLGMDGDNAEVVISDRVFYSINGEPANLVAGLGITSYGQKVNVI